MDTMDTQISATQSPGAETQKSTTRLVSLSEFLAGKVALDDGAKSDDELDAGDTPDAPDADVVVADADAEVAPRVRQRLKPVNFSSARTGRIVDPEVWMDYWSDELVTLWDGLKEHAESMGAAVLDTCEFPAFAQFCWYHSSRYPPAA